MLDECVETIGVTAGGLIPHNTRHFNSMYLPRLIALCIVILSTSAIWAEPLESPRPLADFHNSDGSQPDGKDCARDDTTALRQALAAGAGIVRIGPGYYRFSSVTIPAGVLVVGSGPSTIVRPASREPIFKLTNVADWALRDLTLDGEASGDWKTRSDEGQSGLVIMGCSQFEVSDVRLRNFKGAAMQLSHLAAGELANLQRISVQGSYIGIRFDERAEYVNASHLSCTRNVIGCVIHAGNVKITTSNFCYNVDGMLIEDKDNGSHGTIANSMFNHNQQHALVCRAVKAGMAISECCFFYGTLLLENSKGVNISDGLLSCHIVTKGPNANRIAGNYVFRERHTSASFAPATIVTGNFSDDGPWDGISP